MFRSEMGGLLRRFFLFAVLVAGFWLINSDLWAIKTQAALCCGSCEGHYERCIFHCAPDDYPCQNDCIADYNQCLSVCNPAC